MPSASVRCRFSAEALFLSPTVNFSAGVRNQNWTVVGYVENATNKRYAVDNFSHEGLADSTIFGLGEGNFITTLAPKRRYGLRVRYDL